MSWNQMKLDEVRKLMLSLLLARKGATPLPVFERDYYEAERKRIPFRQFGYTDLLGFLQSMPEHFIIEQHNGGHFVRGIASEKSKHVGSLVSRQKINQKTRYTSPHLHQPFHRRVHHMKFEQIKLSPNTLFLLMQYVKNNPSGVSLQDAVMFVQQIELSTCISMQELRTQLCELSHQLFLDGNMIYPNNNLHNSTYQQPLVEEPQSQNESLSDSGSSPSIQTVCAAGQEDFNCAGYFSDENDFVPAGCTSNYQRYAETSKRFATNLMQYSNCERTGMVNYDKNNDISEDFAMMNSKSNMEMKTAECFDLSQMINDRTKSRLDELMRKHPEGIWCADLPNVYLQEYKVRLNYTQLGFASVREFTSYLPKIFYMTQVNKTDDFLLLSADKRPIVPKTEPINITQTLHNQYDEHSTVQAQCSTDDDDAPIPSEVSPTITKSFAPNNVMNYNDNVEKIPVTDLQQQQNSNRKYLEVYIVEVFHPNFFWIHLRENKKRFNKMMDDLSDFYELNKNIYMIAKIALKKEMNCACIYMGRWHRGIIKSVKPDFRVTVFFYDYGTLKTYAPEDVYYLHKQFSFLPAQAIPCGLYNVKPIVGDRWKKSVIDQFVDKIADTLLVATVITVDSTYNSMMVILTDTEDEEEDVRINDWLVKEKLAQVGKMADAVDMASIMKYVVNNLNQLPTYCFAEENLMPDNCCKATLTEEKYQVPLVSPGPTLLHYDNHHQQQPVRPPPGFPPLGEQRVPSNLSTTNFHNDFSFANASNAKASVFSDAEATTNPFLTDQPVPNDIASMYMSVWNENKKLQIRVIDILYGLLERSSLTFKGQIQLNKILKIIKVLLEQKDDHSTVTKTPSASNPVNGTTLNDVDSAQKSPYNFSSEIFAKQDFNANIFSNPFGVNGDDKSQINTAFSTCGSDSFAFKTNWSQSDELNPHMQMPPSATASQPAPSTFINYISPANTFLPNTNQVDENVSKTPVSPVVPTDTSIHNNFSEFLDSVNIQFANMLKDTNPFKFSMTDAMQVPKTQNEQTSHNYDTGIASCLSAINLQSHASKTETANNHAKSNCFTSAGHVSENYTPRIVYESGPVMYNTQKKQASADAKQNTHSNNLDNIQNTQSLKLGQDKKPTSQSANDIATSYTQHKVINQITRDNLQVDENYVTRPSTYYTQGSKSIINSESTYYQQNGNANNLRPASSQSWNQIEIPEHWANSKFQNSVPLSKHSENAAFGTSTTLSLRDWNRDNGRTFIPREMNEATDSSHIFKFKDGRDEGKPMDIYANFWNNENGSVQQRDVACNINTFVFQKMDSVKGVTFIFNIEQDGWILTHEFVEAFTNLKVQSRLLATLEAMNIKVVFKEIQRSEYPIQFLQLDRYPLNVPRDSEKRIISINLVSLQTALALLHKLKIVSREEIENAFKKNEFLGGSILPNLWILIVTYRDLKRRIELCSNYI